MGSIPTKRSSIASTLVTLALIAALLLWHAGASSVSAKSHLVTAPAAGFVQQNGISLPGLNIYALTTDNAIYVLRPGTNRFTRLVAVSNINGNLIGLDFRPADGNANIVYGLTDTGSIYTINLSQSQLGAATLVSSLSPRFGGGFQSLADFNPVVNALRVIGSNDQNFAVVNSSGGNLNTTAVQTAMSYAQGDVNAGRDPNLAGGAYTNNVAGAAATLFYAIDYDLDAFVTISTRSSTGSSNTGGGVLQTIGSVVDRSGNPINFTPTTDIDIYTDGNGVNTLVGISGQTIFTIDLTQVNQNLQLGATQNITASTVRLAGPTGDVPPTGGFIDIAIPTFVAGQPAPGPAPGPGQGPGQVVGASCTVNFSILNRNQNSFLARVSVQNSSGVTLNGWQFSFVSNGNGQPVTINSIPLNRRFQNGRALTFNYRGAINGGGTASLSNFTLNGITCSVTSR